MKLVIDLRVMQIGHQYRGIGEVFKALIMLYIQKHPNTDCHFVAYPGFEEALEMINLDASKAKVLVMPRINRITKHKYTWFNGRDIDKVIPKDLNEAIYVQLDFSLGVPSKIKSILYFHDLIPLQMQKKYLPKYSDARADREPFKASIKKQYWYYAYIHKVKRSLSRSSKIIAVSNATKLAVMDYFGTPADKMEIGYWANPIEGLTKDPLNALEENRLIQGLKLDKEKFFIFIGGSDPRRRLDLLIAAFNNIKANGSDIKLVLAGYDFREYSSSFIHHRKTRRAVEESSYRDDIYLLGYISDAEKVFLYEHAQALVYPTMLEGFGLNLLEAMSCNCPIIAFNNSSIPEVLGEVPYIVEPTIEHLMGGMNSVIKLTASERQNLRKLEEDNLKRFSWAIAQDLLHKTAEDL